MFGRWSVIYSASYPVCLWVSVFDGDLKLIKSESKPIVFEGADVNKPIGGEIETSSCPGGCPAWLLILRGRWSTSGGASVNLIWGNSSIAAEVLSCGREMWTRIKRHNVTLLAFFYLFDTSAHSPFRVIDIITGCSTTLQFTQPLGPVVYFQLQ